MNQNFLSSPIRGPREPFLELEIPAFRLTHFLHGVSWSLNCMTLTLLSVSVIWSSLNYDLNFSDCGCFVSGIRTLDKGKPRLRDLQRRRYRDGNWKQTSSRNSKVRIFRSCGSYQMIRMRSKASWRSTSARSRS